MNASRSLPSRPAAIAPIEQGKEAAREATRLSGAEKKDAEDSFTRALDLARRQRAKSLELRAVTSLATYLETHGRGSEGRERVKTVLESFTEGFDTPDLLAAKRFLT